VLTEGATLSYLGDKIQIPPFGVQGAESSGANAFGVIRDGKEFDPAPVSGKVTGYRVISGDVTFSRSAGGGGYGDPLERDANEVATDVAYGYVSERGALEDYGVVVRAKTQRGVRTLEDWEVDDAATQEERARLRHRRRAFTLVQARGVTTVGGRHLCFASHATLAALEVESGTPIEILSPVGAPLRLWVEAEEGVPDASLAVDEPTLEVLNLVFGDRCPVRRLRTTRG